MSIYEMECVRKERSTNYKERVLKCVLRGTHESKSVYELRLWLFIEAANYYFKYADGCLQPFPPCFYDPKNRNRRYDSLKMHLRDIPSMAGITEDTLLPTLTWKLLHWVLTSDQNMKAFTTSSKFSSYYTRELRYYCNLRSIPHPNKRCTRFEIFHPNSDKRQRFLEERQTFGSFFAYHGSPPQHFYSIIHNGLVGALNTDKVYGYGTYLTSSLDVAVDKAQRNFSPSSHPNSQRSDNGYIVAIVEVVRNPSVLVVDCGGRSKAVSITPETDCTSKKAKYFIVDNFDLMLLRQLLVFDI